jgi:hypothetical protein
MCEADDLGSAGWSLTGNTGTNPAANFVGTTDAQPLVLKTNGAERLRIHENGRVGIGTNNPEFPLHVGLDNSVRFELGINNKLSLGGNGIFEIDAPGEARGRFVVNDAGRVGIGKNNPAAKLHVRTYVNLGTLDTAIFEAAIAGPNLSHIHAGEKGDWYIRSAASDGKVIVQDTGGRVGVGTADPQATLHVNGEIRVEALASASSTNLCINANTLASCSSSARYKENIADLTLGMDAIQQLRPVTFDWKGRDEQDLGLVAEQVNQVSPLLTTRTAGGEIEGVKYAQVTALLIKGMQEQQAQIEDLQLQNRQLQARLAVLGSGATPELAGANLLAQWLVLGGGLIVAVLGLLYLGKANKAQAAASGKHGRTPGGGSD